MNTFFHEQRNFQKLAIVGLLIIGQALAAPGRLRRDAPVLPSWQVPNVGFGGEGRSDIFEVPFDFGTLHDEYGVPAEEYGPPAEEYGPPAEEYGPPPVPHEEYGPPEVPQLRVTTEQ